MKVTLLAYAIHTILTHRLFNRPPATQSSCKPLSKEKRYELIKSISEKSKANQKLIHRVPRTRVGYVLSDYDDNDNDEGDEYYGY